MRGLRVGITTSFGFALVFFWGMVVDEADWDLELVLGREGWLRGLGFDCGLGFGLVRACGCCFAFGLLGDFCFGFPRDAPDNALDTCVSTTLRAVEVALGRWELRPFATLEIASTMGTTASAAATAL